jgi:hypothetical protein
MRARVRANVSLLIRSDAGAATAAVVVAAVAAAAATGTDAGAGTVANGAGPPRPAISSRGCVLTVGFRAVSVSPPAHLKAPIVYSFLWGSFGVPVAVPSRPHGCHDRSTVAAMLLTSAPGQGRSAAPLRFPAPGHVEPRKRLEGSVPLLLYAPLLLALFASLHFPTPPIHVSRLHSPGTTALLRWTGAHMRCRASLSVPGPGRGRYCRYRRGPARSV